MITALQEYSEYLKNGLLDGSITVLAKLTKKGPTALFLKFSSLCQAEENTICTEEISFAEMVYRVLHPELKYKCHCGNKLKFVNIRQGYRRTCSITCRGNSPEYIANLSAAKAAQYNDPKQKAAIEAKKIATNMANLGVAHPMQNLQSFEKQNKSSFRNRRTVSNELKLQGYEPELYEFISHIYGANNIQKGTDYMKTNNVVINWKDDEGKQRYSYPDFFVKDLNAFIEVKSEYTVKIGEYKIAQCIKRLSELQFGYIMCVVYPKKTRNSLVFTQYNKQYIVDPDDGCSADFFNPYFNTKEELHTAIYS